MEIELTSRHSGWSSTVSPGVRFIRSTAIYSLFWFGSWMSLMWATSGPWALASFCCSAQFVLSTNYVDLRKPSNLFESLISNLQKKGIYNVLQLCRRKSVQPVIMGAQWTHTEHGTNGGRDWIFHSYHCHPHKGLACAHHEQVLVRYL